MNHEINTMRSALIGMAICLAFGCSQKTIKASGQVEAIHSSKNGKCSVKIKGDESNNYWHVQNCLPIPLSGGNETIIHDNETGFYYLDR